VRERERRAREVRAALRRIVAIALVPVVLALSLTAVKRVHGNRSATLKKIEATYEYERNAHNNYLVYAFAQGWYRIEALFHFAACAEEAVSRLP
jgi:hypothetical protein